MIPKIIHRIWIGDEMPIKYRSFGDEWKSLHPSWEMKLWSELDLREIGNAKLTNAINSNDFDCAKKVNLARIVVLSLFGGIYADVDVKPIKPLDDLINDDYDIGVGAIPNQFKTPQQSIDCNLLISSKDCNQWKSAIDEYPEELPRATWICKRIESMNRVKIFPYTFFQDLIKTPQTYSLHWPHRLGSWIKK